MHSNLKRLTASKVSVKSRTQTTISRFFNSAGDKGVEVDEPRISCVERKQDSKGKVSMGIRHAYHI